MVDKEGIDTKKQAMEAYIAAREVEIDETSKVAEHDVVSSALIDKVVISFSIGKILDSKSILNKSYLFPPLFCCIQVDTLLHNLEKEIDTVDAVIGDRWRLLDRFVISHHLVEFSPCSLNTHVYVNM